MISTARPSTRDLTVLGNKGSTDQHSYIQQLRDGLEQLLRDLHRGAQDRSGIVDRSGTKRRPRRAISCTGSCSEHGRRLSENERVSLTLTIKEVSPFTVGVLIALFERAVGFYASLVNINAYHQPGVEAGKKAAGSSSSS